jgi:hypothetical protein
MKLSTKAGFAALAAALISSPLPVAAASAAPAEDIVLAQAQTQTPARGPAARTDKGIARQEYLDQAAKRFDAMDADHDGTVTTVERRAYDRKMAEERKARRGTPMNRSSMGPAAPGNPPSKM